MFASRVGWDHFCDVTAKLIRWTRQFPYRGGRVLVERLNDGWRLELHGSEASARSLVSAFEQVRQRPCADREIEVVLVALAYNERQHKAAAA